jgi:predicted small secreted protein
MKNILLPSYLLMVATSVFLTACNQNTTTGQSTQQELQKSDYGGFESQIKYGEHLVTICGCNDCHTPKKMGANGPEPDPSLLLSGHPAQLASISIDRKDMENKGLVCTNDLTAWVGPWGISYASNLTPDPTGMGNWDESNFMVAMRQGKAKGIASGRDMLPPMPWESLGKMTDNELKAVFAYLKSIKPIKNIVPDPAPPVLVAK